MERKGDRVAGPYRRRNRWRIHVYVNGVRTCRDCPSEAAALRLIQDVEAELARTAGRTIEEAIDEYTRHLMASYSPDAIATTIRRLERFFPEHGASVAGFKAGSAKALYDDMREEVGADGQLIYAVASHRGALSEAKSFWRWCMGKQYARADAFENVKGVGKKKRGKAQPTNDEAKKWYDYAYHLASRGSSGSAAALFALVFALRSKEVVRIVVRDVDDEGHLLRIPRSKSAAGVRNVQVPDEIRPILLRLTRGKGPHEYLFSTEDGQHHHRAWVNRWVHVICEKVGIPPVTAHGMRGYHSTVATEAGATAALITSQLGHASFEMTKAHYVKPGTISAVNQRRVMELVSGRRGPQATRPNRRSEKKASPK